MISRTVKQALQQFVPAENIRYEEPLKNHTTFRIGGPADCMISVDSAVQMQNILWYLRQVDLPFFILGNGSNLLVGDGGYPGVVLRMTDGMNAVTVDGCRVRAQAGASMAKAARVAMEHGLTGLEFASGIPGSTGGGVIMNAGAYGGEMSQVVESVTVLDPGGEILTLDNETMCFGYRTSAIKTGGFVVLECVFLLQSAPQEEIRERMDDFAGRRREKQPLEYPSAGSTFKRPRDHFAGKLIMDAGLRGLQVGGARVSDKHCGFIINCGDATAADVRALMERVQEEVFTRFHVRLEPEIIMLGEF
ncbi:MAG: UDP-N-acetylmuramate dehydrogenase [Lachnospiraceae bacterium]|nr:UDP-N-acetylmuramate dehydrogenase [Lachnospiraceae bacterium]